MRRRNGIAYPLRLIDATSMAAEAGNCLVCGQLLPQVAGRQFCLRHSEYARGVMARLQALPRQARVARRA